MSAHLYWRLHVWAVDGGNAVGLQELAMHTSIGGADVCTGGTATASETYTSFSPANAFDQNSGTLWGTTYQTYGAWLAYQLTSPQAIVEYAITARNDTYYQQSPSAWTFEYSDDGLTWTVADSVRNQLTWAQGSAFSFLVGANTGNPKGLSVGQQMKALRPAVQTGSNAPNIVQVGRSPTPGPKTVSGTVTVNGVATAGLLVRAYAKATGELIGQATTVANGSFAIKCGANWADVTVLAYDPTTYAALVFDRIVPA